METNQEVEVGCESIDK